MTTHTYRFNNKKYRVDTRGFLLFAEDWDEDYAEGQAASVGIEGGLTDRHWKVIRFIRNTMAKIGDCPLVYVACKENHLGLGDLNELFPAGYLRGACKLAGVTYREAYLQHLWLQENRLHNDWMYRAKTYSIDIRGFLLDPSQWDEGYAVHRAYDMKMPEYLTEKHFAIIRFLRARYMENNEVPTVYETCEQNNIDLGELERLFPDGYHRGAVKLAGLRVR